MSTVDNLMTAIIDAHDEVRRAQAKYPDLNSAHEGYGVLTEEYRELEEHVFTKERDRDLAAMRKEAIQVAAVALRIAAEVCNEQVGRR